MESQNVGSSTLLGTLASSAGTSEHILRLLLSLFMGYPLGLIHRYTLYGKKPEYQHLFFAISGFAIGYFNYHWQILHSLFTVVGVHMILYLVGGTLYSIILILLSTMVYLLVGYYVECTEVYDINWTISQCIITLRLTGLAIDVYDGRKPTAMLSSDTKKTALKFTPTLLEIAAYTYFPASFLIGPQYPIKRYLEFVAGTYRQPDGNGGSVPPNGLWPGFKRGALGILYLAIYQVGISYFQDDYMLSSEFVSQPFYSRCIFLGIWGKITLYKYISFWLITDGICIITGLAYNGVNECKQIMWDGCANVNVSVYEKATKFEHLISSFNISTNRWVSQYVYKRFKCLGNRYISQVVSMLFLSIWHGLYSGYYVCFLMEFAIMYAEKDIENILAKNASVAKFINRPVLLPIRWVFQKCVILLFMGYSLVGFVLLSYDKWYKVYKAVYFVGHIVFMSWPLCSYLIKISLKTKQSYRSQSSTNEPSSSETISKSSSNEMNQHLE